MRKLVAERVSVETVRLHVIRSKFEAVTGNRNLSDEQIDLIVEMLDEVSPNHVFRALNDEIRKLPA